MNHEYDDIIHLPHRVSMTRSQMSMHDRAAQFSPFAALTGYEESIKEAARLTDRKIELNEDEIADLNMKLQILNENLLIKPQVTILYFVPDQRKCGGAYHEITGVVKKIDEFQREIIMTKGAKIALEDILTLDCELFMNLSK